jgi:predicted nucleotidyltransferase component of viral defense system
MISEAEIRRLAAVAQVDPMVIDLDYSLGWCLAGLSSIHDFSNSLVFKGGTCLRKCYFNGYRFSEDLDFTAIKKIESDQLRTWVEQMGNWSADREGPDFAIEPIRVEIIDDDYGKESFQIRAYFRGPLVWSGSRRVIRVHVTRDEKFIQPPIQLHLMHSFSDEETLGSPILNCYSLLEILAEKLRAISGQRRFAISRDLYDIYNLIQSGVSISDVLPMVPVKFKVHEIDINAIDPIQFLARKPEFERDWQKRLSYLVSGQNAVTFENAWETSLDLLQTLKKWNNGSV